MKNIKLADTGHLARTDRCSKCGKELGYETSFLDVVCAKCLGVISLPSKTDDNNQKKRDRAEGKTITTMTSKDLPYGTPGLLARLLKLDNQ